MELTQRISCLSWIIKSSGKVTGKTRLQKLAFLTAKTVKGIEKIEFYNDWMPGDYGPFSRKLSIDIKQISTEGAKQLVKVYDAPTISGEKVLDSTTTTYLPTSLGERAADDFELTNPSLGVAIKKITTRYAGAPLVELVHDVYYQFPKYTVSSKIRGQISVKDTLLDPIFD